MSPEKPKIYVILGPTASGKTALAVALARKIDAEIISADSRQVYKSLDIGTGKDLAEYGDVKYHLINIKDAGEKYNLADFQKDYTLASEKILKAKKNVILCGGTGLYVQAIVENFSQTQIPPNPDLRAMLETMSSTEILKTYKINQDDFKLDLSNRKRLIRAIELSVFKSLNPDFELEKPKNAYQFKIFGLNPNLENRRMLIQKRLLSRINNGLVQEVKTLLDQGVPYETLQYYGLEYKYVSSHVMCQLSLEAMTEKLNTEINRYAKRQMTFFRSMERKGIEINWLPENLSQSDQIAFIQNKA
jgi:tRNA dimethylallyltransferase